MNPLDILSSFLEIGILLLISFILGFVAAKIPLGSNSEFSFLKKEKNALDVQENVDPRDIITEPQTIRAVLTRDRKGNAVSNTEKSKSKKSKTSKR